MTPRKLTGALLLALALLWPAPGGGEEAEARPTGKAAAKHRDQHRTAKRVRDARSSKRVARRPTRRKGRRVCSGRGAKRRCRYVRFFSGHGVQEAVLRKDPLPKPSGDLWVYAVNFREELRLNVYGEDGQLDDDALARLDHVFRCKRTGEERAFDPRLYETLSTIFDHFGGRRIEIISGFRYQRNEGSRHFHASAMDIHIEGVSIRELYDFAQTLDPGGMGIGIYPASGFVHVDYRAPGEPSYRWTDRSGREADPGKLPSKSWKPQAKKPTS